MDAKEKFCGYTDEDFINILSVLKTLDTEYIILSGGEPCMHPRILHFVDLAYESGLKVGIATNGTVITDRMLDCFARNKVFLQVSIDAIRYPEYFKSRGSDQLNKVVSNLKRLQKRDISVTLACTLTDLNAEYAIEICDFAKKMQLSTIHFGPVIPSGRCLSVGLKFQKFFTVMMQLYHYQIENYLDIQIDIVEEIVNLIANSPEEGASETFFCNAMAGKNIQIDVSGNVRRCGLIESAEPLNILDCFNRQGMTVGEIAEKCTCIAIQTSATDIPLCRECEYIQLCRGGCRACAFNVTGDYMGELPYCNGFKRFIQVVKDDYHAGKLDGYLSFLQLMHLVERKRYDTTVKRIGIF